MTKELAAVSTVPDPTVEAFLHEEFLSRHTKLASRKFNRMLQEGALMSRQTLDIML
jgi:hypothetical protein